MLFVFQLALFALVALSFLLVVGVPVAFASPEGWSQNKGLVLSGSGLWLLLVFAVGVLNSFVVLGSRIPHRSSMGKSPSFVLTIFGLVFEMKGFPSLPTTERKAAWRLSRWKLSLLVIQHRERMQLRLVQNFSDEVIAWRRRSFFPAVWFLSQLPSQGTPPSMALSTTPLDSVGSIQPPSRSSVPSEKAAGAQSYWKLPYSRISIPTDPLKQSSGRWGGATGREADRGERFLGPVYGPRPLTNPERLQRFLGGEEFERWEATRLLGPQKASLKARYGVRGKTQQTLAKARLGQATLRARWSRRFLTNRLVSDRPYRSIRASDLVLGRRTRPFRASRLRPRRRNDVLAESLRRERSSLQGIRKTRLVKGQQSLVRLSDEQSWSRFVLPQNPLLAQERRQWWREWHQNDRRNLYETRRAGSLQRDRVGRRNLGWWRFLGSSHIDLPNSPRDEIRQTPRYVRRPFAREDGTLRWFSQTEPTLERVAWAYPSRMAPVRDQRSVPIGWATRLKNPNQLEKVVSQTPKGGTDYANSYWRLFAPLSQASLWLVPCSFATLWSARLILGQSFLSVQMDFVRALDQLVRRGGRREMDPEWMEWLLETLGVSQQNAGIRHYSPGTRSLARTLAGLRRESSTLLEVIWYLRTQRRQTRLLPQVARPESRGPRPTLLVGAPGTGKTRLVRVLADEAGVPVIYQCLAAFTDAGSNFTAFGFGRTVAPRAVQRGFAEARERVPAILFLDELDALGANRGGVLLDAQTNPPVAPRSGDQVLGLGQLLVELDSRAKNQGLVVFGATNRPAELDPALLRPGRFDRHLSIPLPNRKKRRAILQLYARQRGLNTASWNWNRILTQTRGASAAHLARITNWTAISRVLAPAETSTSLLLEQSLQRLLRGQTDSTQPQTTGRDPFVQLRPVYGKARQGVVQRVLGSWDPLRTLSIQTSNPLPSALFSPTRYRTQKEKRRALATLFAPRIAEWMLLRSFAGKTRSYWQQRNSPGLGWWLTSWLQDRNSLQKTTQTFSARSLFAKEFQQDRPLLKYSLDRTRKPKDSTTSLLQTFSSILTEVKQQEEWPSEWYSFEIPEVRGFRSVHWLPPELHMKPQTTAPANSAPTTRPLRLELYKQTSGVLQTRRAELDLVVSLLLQQMEVPMEEVVARLG